VRPKVATGFGLPEGSDGWTDWTWFHAGYPRPLRLTILCDAPVNYSGHFRKGRMVPCLSEGCPLCAAGFGNQARYVFSVVEWESRRVGLLELGRGQALRVQDWMESNGGLRGMSIEVVRSSIKKQSGLELSLISEEAPIYFQHLQGPDLQRAVVATWAHAVCVTLEGVPSGVTESARSA